MQKRRVARFQSSRLTGGVAKHQRLNMNDENTPRGLAHVARSSYSALSFRTFGEVSCKASYADFAYVVWGRLPISDLSAGLAARRRCRTPAWPTGPDGVIFFQSDVAQFSFSSQIGFPIASEKPKTLLLYHIFSPMVQPRIFDFDFSICDCIWPFVEFRSDDALVVVHCAGWSQSIATERMASG